MGMDIFELVMEVEDQFDINFSEQSESRVKTVRDVYEVIVKDLGSRNMARSTKCPTPPWTEPEILERLRCITSKMFKVPIKRVKLDARLIEDLGAG